MAVGAVKYWFNGLPLDGLSSTAGAVKYWFNGLPYDTLSPSAAPSPISAIVDVTQANNTVFAASTILISVSADILQANNTVSAAGTVSISASADLFQDNNTIFATAVATPLPTTSKQVFIDIQTAARSFTTRKRMF